MKIFTHSTNNPKIMLIELMGALTGKCETTELQEWLFTCLGEGKYYQIINLGHITEIDGAGINILRNLANRGMQIRLFDVKPEVSRIFKISGKEGIPKIYNVTECDKAVSMLAKEISENEAAIENNIKQRRYPRFDTWFPVEFECHPGHNGAILSKANVLNLGEGGIFANQIRSIDIETGKKVSSLEIVGKELYNLKFRLNLYSRFIETKGNCVWENKTDKEFSAGIHFKDMIVYDKQRIRDYVYNDFQF